MALWAISARSHQRLPVAGRRIDPIAPQTLRRPGLSDGVIPVPPSSHYATQRAPFIRGLLLAKGGHHHEGLVQMNQGLEARQTTGAGLNRAYFLAQLAETYGRVGQPEGGLALVAEALELMKKTGERWWEAELHRLRGALLLVHKGSDDAISSDRPTVAEAEASLQRALATARQQQAKALELLTPLFAWFTEGIDTADLRQAQALLDGLS